MKRHAWIFAIALILAFPAAAQASRGFASINLNLRAGPDIGYPVVDFIPAGARLYVHGCTFDWSWCDVSIYGERGWVGGDFIDYPYGHRWVSVYDYGGLIGIPVVSFVIGDYWHSHYRHRHFYRDRNYWYRHRFAYHPVPRYRHDRRHVYGGYRYDRYDRRDRYRGDDARRVHRDRHDRRDRGDWRRDPAPRDRSGFADRRRHDAGGQARSRQRLAPSVRDSAMPRRDHAGRTYSRAPARHQGSNPRLARGAQSARSRAPSQHRADPRQTDRHGKKRHKGRDHN